MGVFFTADFPRDSSFDPKHINALLCWQVVFSEKSPRLWCQTWCSLSNRESTRWWVVVQQQTKSAWEVVVEVHRVKDRIAGNTACLDPQWGCPSFTLRLSDRGAICKQSKQISMKQHVECRLLHNYFNKTTDWTWMERHRQRISQNS